MATEDDDLFEEAMNAEKAAGKQPVDIIETEAEAEPQGEQAETEAPSQAAPTPPQAENDQPPAAPSAAQDGQDRQLDPRIPLRELLDEREARQKAQREAEDVRRQLEQIRRQQQAAQAPKQDPEQMFADPVAWQRGLQQTFQEQLAQVALNNDLRFAELKHGPTFAEGFNAFMQRVGTGQDAALYQSVMQSPSPGEAIVQWHKRERVVSEVGDDPSAYEQRIREKVLAEIAAQQSSQQPNGQGRPSNITRLPPSLNRVTTAAAADDFDDGDGSDEAIFRAGEAASRRR